MKKFLKAISPAYMLASKLGKGGSKGDSKGSAEPQGKGMLSNLARKSGGVEPQDGGDVGRPSRRGGFSGAGMSTGLFSRPEVQAEMKKAVAAGRMKSGGDVKSKMMASGGMMKSKMMASGGKTPATKKALADHAAKPASKAHAGMKAGGMMKKGYASGGMPMVMKDGKKVPTFAADGKGKMAMGGNVMSKMKAGGGVGASKMGAVKTSSKMDGVAVKGKTKGRMV